MSHVSCEPDVIHILEADPVVHGSEDRVGQQQQVQQEVRITPKLEAGSLQPLPPNAVPLKVEIIDPIIDTGTWLFIDTGTLLFIDTGTWLSNSIVDRFEMGKSWVKIVA